MDPETEKLVNELKSAFHEFKEANDDRLSLLEKKGHAPADYVEKVDRINKAMTANEARLNELKKSAEEAVELKKRLDTLETAVRRPGAGSSQGEVKSWDGKRILSTDEIGHKKAFEAYVRKGVEPNEEERKAMYTSSDPDGGYTVTPDMSGRIVQKIFETSPVRRFASVQNISSDALEGSYDDNEASAGWVGEQASRTETNTPQIGVWRISAHEVYAKPKASQRLLDDSNINIEQWLAGKIADKFARMENLAFLTGTPSTAQPRGMLTYATTSGQGSRASGGTIQQVNSGSSGALTTDFIVSLPHKIKEAYRNRGAYFLSREGIEKSRLLKDSAGRYLWAPGWGDIISGVPSTLNGYRIGEFNDLPAFAASSLSVMFGDLAEGYQIVDRQGIRTLRDPYSAKPFVEFYTTKRVGGDVINFEAFVIGKLAV